MEKNNPFKILNAVVDSNYSLFNGQKLELVYFENGEISPKVNFAHNQLRHVIMDPHFPCAGAKTAFYKNTYRFGFYPRIASELSTELLCYDLFNFIQEQKRMETDYSTFIASFETPIPADEKQFETLLWKQLQMVNELDSKFHAWNEKVSDNVNDENFSFSFSGESFFIVGLHPASSRYARRFVYPSLVFNSHQQFNNLKLKNKFERLQKTIRKNDTKLQGHINPNLTNFGEDSEAKQYSGKKINSKWECPFKNKSNLNNKNHEK